MNAAQPKTFGLGWVKDASHKRTQKSSYELLGTSPVVPAASSLEQYEAACLDQGRSGSCGGHGTAQAIFVSCAAARKPLLWTPSPRGVYAITRQIARIQGLPANAPLPVLTDSGVMPADIMTAVTWGIHKMAAPTPDGRNSDVWSLDDVRGLPNAPPANVNDEEDIASFEADALTVVTGEYRILETASDVITQMCAALSGVGTLQNGVPCAVGFGGFVDGAVMDWKAGDPPLTKFDTSDPRGGGHWFCKSSYSTGHFNGYVKRVFRVINSWGADYGDRGHFEVTEDWVYQQVPMGCDIYPFHVADVSPKKVAA
jgi:hypothetical protein